MSVRVRLTVLFWGLWWGRASWWRAGSTNTQKGNKRSRGRGRRNSDRDRERDGWIARENLRQMNDGPGFQFPLKSHIPSFKIFLPLVPPFKGPQPPSKAGQTEPLTPLHPSLVLHHLSLRNAEAEVGKSGS